MLLTEEDCRRLLAQANADYAAEISALRRKGLGFGERQAEDLKAGFADGARWMLRLVRELQAEGKA